MRESLLKSEGVPVLGRDGLNRGCVVAPAKMPVGVNEHRNALVRRC